MGGPFHIGVDIIGPKIQWIYVTFDSHHRKEAQRKRKLKGKCGILVRPADYTVAGDVIWRVV